MGLITQSTTWFPTRCLRAWLITRSTQFSPTCLRAGLISCTELNFQKPSGKNSAHCLISPIRPQGGVDHQSIMKSSTLSRDREYDSKSSSDSQELRNRSSRISPRCLRAGLIILLTLNGFPSRSLRARLIIRFIDTDFPHEASGRGCSSVQREPFQSQGGGHNSSQSMNLQILSSACLTTVTSTIS